MESPLHLLIPGKPVSFQSNRTVVRAWKEKVASIARAKVSSVNTDHEMAVSITHFYRRPPRFDADNMAKPICDALNTIVYHDDSQIVERVARRIPISRAFDLWRMPPELALALCKGEDFVFIRVIPIRAVTLAAIWQRAQRVWA